jgi:hypothetical protein
VSCIDYLKEPVVRKIIRKKKGGGKGKYMKNKKDAQQDVMLSKYII